MANGHGVKRQGFTSPDDKLKGGRFSDDLLDGQDGDDVIIGFGGNDTLLGGDGEDDLSGGDGDDLLVGAIWEDADTDLITEGIQGNGLVDDADTFTQDAFSDDFNAEADFESNGTDTIWFYDADDGDGVVDVIDLSKPMDFEDTDLSLTIEDSEKLAQMNENVFFDSGALKDGDGNTWFDIYTDAGATSASTVYVEVDGDQFMWDGSEWVFA